jgi:hypothetical protein
MHKISQSEAIREAVYSNPTITNKGIKNYCKNHYNFIPSNALIYEVAGAAKKRGLHNMTASQMMEIKGFASKNFDNDYDALLGGVLAVKAAIK